VRGGGGRPGSPEEPGRPEPRRVADGDARRPEGDVRPPQRARRVDPGRRPHGVHRRLLLGPRRQWPRGVFRAAAQRVASGAPLLGEHQQRTLPRPLGRAAPPVGARPRRDARLAAYSRDFRAGGGRGRSTPPLRATARSLARRALTRRDALTSSVLLRTERLTRSFGRLLAVNAVDFEVRAGELRSVIGPNGAGKSTFFKLIA